ncbi:MAG TPA: ABC transporter ATP-binding protein [Alphaproteobacteria bacterium]|nr:ABC transporter ATP-binding protein [Alphaproteobacteria bacterium]
MSDIDVRLDNVSKEYGAVKAVDSVSLAIERGTIYSLLGPSGCGKTTTLRLIAGFEQPSSGEVLIRGTRVNDVPPYKRDISIVFQSYALFPHLTVGDNIAFGLRMRRVPRAERDKAVAEALNMVKLGGYADRYPRQLSGGQQQRVALARAIVIKPAVLLLDEPLGALDKMLREEMQVELRQLQQRLGITAVFVTHDQEEALTLSDRVAVMRNGRLEQVGAPREIYERPRTEFVAGFLGASNFFDGRVVARREGIAEIEIKGWRVQARDEGSAGERVRIAVRPERTWIGAPGEFPHAARVREIIYRGSSTHYYLESEAGPVLVYRQNDAPGQGAWQPGSAVSCGWAPESGVIVAPVDLQS